MDSGAQGQSCTTDCPGTLRKPTRLHAAKDRAFLTFRIITGTDVAESNHVPEIVGEAV
jgi:hypothetical protein